MPRLKGGGEANPKAQAVQLLETWQILTLQLESHARGSTASKISGSQPESRPLAGFEMVPKYLDRSHWLPMNVPCNFGNGRRDSTLASALG